MVIRTNVNLIKMQEISYHHLSPVAAWVPDINFNFYLAKNQIIAKNSTTAAATEKISTDLDS
jgi:hypothetical protein